MQQVNVRVERYEPETGSCRTQMYSIPLEQGDTVLQALLRIYEEHDSSLAFRYGCRGSKCGQCVVEVNGAPRLACVARAQDDMIISPLKNLPRLRDLVVDRSPIDRLIAAQGLFVIPGVEEPLGPFAVPQIYQRLIGCLECYGCISACPRFDWRNEGFGGPYVFVRLAQLHLDPRDTEDRRAQARALGVEQCRDCFACRCVKGIAIRKEAIATLLNEQTD